MLELKEKELIFKTAIFIRVGTESELAISK